MDRGGVRAWRKRPRISDGYCGGAPGRPIFLPDEISARRAEQVRSCHRRVADNVRDSYTERMPTLALLHTASVNVTTFDGLCRELMPDVAVFHVLDESLLKNTIRDGEMS